jgi:hypothetical protein
VFILFLAVDVFLAFVAAVWLIGRLPGASGSRPAGTQQSRSQEGKRRADCERLEGLHVEGASMDASLEVA